MMFMIGRESHIMAQAQSDLMNIKAPGKPAHVLWIEGESFNESNGRIIAESSCYGGREVVFGGQEAQYATYYFNSSAEGFYQLHIAGGPVGADYISPIWLALDAGGSQLQWIHKSQADKTGNASWGESSATRWTTLGTYRLKAGQNRLSIKVTEPRQMDSNNIYYIDAIAFTRADAGVYSNISEPPVTFYGDAAEFAFDILNSTPGAVSGKVILRWKNPQLPEKILAENCRIEPQSAGRITGSINGMPSGAHGYDVLLVSQNQAQSTMRQIGSGVLRVTENARPQAGRNILRNASFELASQFNGTPMRQGDDEKIRYLQCVQADPGKAPWSVLPIEGWWCAGPDADGVSLDRTDVRSGGQALRVVAQANAPRSVVSSLGNYVPPGALTMSAYIKTIQAKAQLELDLTTGLAEQIHGKSQLKKVIELPADSGWRRVSLTAESPAMLQALLRLKVSRGTVLLDDVQLELGTAATAFNLRPEEWFRLSVDGQDESRMPKWTAGAEMRHVTLANDSRLPLSGLIQVHFGTWDQPLTEKLAEIKASDLAPGQVRRMTFSTPLPDAYLISVNAQNSQSVGIVNGAHELRTDQPTGGNAPPAMLRSRSALRIAAAPAIAPNDYFGIGNSTLMIDGNYHASEQRMHAFLEGREIGLISNRNRFDDDRTFMSAAGRISIHAWDDLVDANPPKGSSFVNPVFPDGIDIFNPDGWEYIMARARRVGRELADNPLATSFQMANEQVYFNRAHLCPTPWADADFRAWCRQRYGDLTTLNSHWNTRYTKWEEIEPIVNARMAEMARVEKKTGAAAADWTAQLGNLTEPVMQKMQANPGQAMDWMRWWSDSSLRLYRSFRAEARKADTKTLYGTNLCWPAFWPHFFMPFARAMDVNMLDVQYTAGLTHDLGIPSEMMDNLEMAESADRSKRVWGAEVYHQPTFPAEFMPFQNWGLVAHGMTNNMTFAWRPYADVGAITDTRAWEKPDAPPMWLLIDNDDFRIPAFETYKKSIREINAFHQKFNALKINRARTNIAFYVSPDTGHYVVMQTGNKPWGSAWQRTRNTLIYTLRMAGITVDYVDDETLPDQPGHFQTLIVTPSYVLNQKAAEKIAGFARSGGTVIMAGMSGICDPWLNRYPNIGGQAWKELGWAAPEYRDQDRAAAVFVPDAGDTRKKSSLDGRDGMDGEKDPAIVESKTFRGSGITPLPSARPLKDMTGRDIGWSRPWGRGQLIAYGIIADSYSRGPHPSANITAWVRQMIATARLPYTGRFIPSGRTVMTGKIGQGSPVVEVVVREKGDHEKFVFCLNQGGRGSGDVEVTLAGGNWIATDALTGQPILDGKVQNGAWRWPVELAPFGYRVIHLQQQ